MSRKIESLARLILLIVIGIRPLIGESYDSAGTPFATPGTVLTDPTPLRTLFLDMAVLVTGALWLVARAWDGRSRYRRTGIEIGLAIVALAAIVSCVFAGQKRLAINATIDWLCLPILAILLVQLLRRPWHIRLTLCVILAGAATNAAECFFQITYSFQETERSYYQNREASWALQGVPLDSPQVEMFERRLAAREATGYLWHSNVTGAYLMLAAFAAAGLAWARWRGPPAPLRRWLGGCAGVIAMVLMGAAVTTRSTGALMAAGVGVALVVTVSLLRRWIERRRRAVFRAGWACVIAGTAAVIGHGVYHGSLLGPPYSSINFRWQYWTAASQLIADRPLTGVGLENFGRHYVQYKSISSPEEIKSPHNFLVSAAADWGVPGLIGVLVMVVGASMVLIRPSAYDARQEDLAPPDPPPSEPGRPLLWMLVLALGIFVPRWRLLGTDDFAYLYWMSAFPLILWVSVFVLTVLDRNDIGRISDDPLPRLPLLINCGLIAFLLSDVINFALYVPATATTFFALLGVGMAMRVRSQPSDANAIVMGPLARWGPVASAVIAVSAVGVFFVAPVARSTNRLADARKRFAGSGEPPIAMTWDQRHRRFMDAAAADPLDPTALAECARVAREYSIEADSVRILSTAIELLDQAAGRDPFSLRLARDQRNSALLLAVHAGEAPYYIRAISAADRAVSLYPTSPQEYLSLGDCYAGLGTRPDDGDRNWRASAIDAYRRALELDDARPDWEVIRRLSPQTRSDVEWKIDQLQQSRASRTE